MVEQDLARAEVTPRSPWVFLDARGPKIFMASPEPDLEGHVGTHPAMLQHVLSPLLARNFAMQLLRRWPESGQEPIVVVVYGNDGRHMAVAWSHWLHALLAIMDYRPMVILGAADFRNTCGQTSCPSCDQPPQTSMLFEAMARFCVEA
jgi:hypothetical protein